SRRTESDLQAELQRLRPQLLGALLDAVVGGLWTAPSVKLPRLPRMADFALWGEAVWRGLGNPDGAFLCAYRDSIAGANVVSLEASPVAVAVLRFMQGRTCWQGTARELLAALVSVVGEEAARKRGWPGAPHVLSGALKKAAPALRRAGIQVERHADHERRV